MRNCQFLFNFMSSFSRKNVYGREVFGWDECAGHLYIALVLSFIYGIGDALIKSLDKDLRNAMEQDHDTTFHTRDHHPRPAYQR
jgi:hypothetical protein